MFVVISGRSCVWCEKARHLLAEKNLDFEDKSLTTMPWLKTILGMSNLNTVPQIFRPDGELIGGYKALEIYLGINIDG